MIPTKHTGQILTLGSIPHSSIEASILFGTSVDEVELLMSEPTKPFSASRFSV
jgi:hypothetical protein